MEQDKQKGGKCSFCHHPGARWTAILGNERLAVHSSCGKILAATAPKGQVVKIFPSEELRAEWRAKTFWEAKLKLATKKP